MFCAACHQKKQTHDIYFLLFNILNKQLIIHNIQKMEGLSKGYQPLPLIGFG